MKRRKNNQRKVSFQREIRYKGISFFYLFFYFPPHHMHHEKDPLNGIKLSMMLEKLVSDI